MNLEAPFLTDPKQIKAWLDSMGVKKWKLNNGLADVVGNVNLAGKLGLLTKLPVRFGKVGGNFNCSNSKLVSLVGVPEKVGLNFGCSNNQLVSLEGAPKLVGGDFWCSINLLVSLEGAPKVVGRDFSCESNQLASLEGAPEEVDGHFYCGHNQLVSLKGAPFRVDGDFWCNNNLLVDFKGMEGVSIVGNLAVINPYSGGQDNVFVALDGLPKELYSKVQGLDMQVMLELENKRAANPLSAKIEELSSEVELG